MKTRDEKFALLLGLNQVNLDEVVLNQDLDRICGGSTAYGSTGTSTSSSTPSAPPTPDVTECKICEGPYC